MCSRYIHACITLDLDMTQAPLSPTFVQVVPVNGTYSFCLTVLFPSFSFPAVPNNASPLSSPLLSTFSKGAIDHPRGEARRSFDRSVTSRKTSDAM